MDTGIKEQKKVDMKRKTNPTLLSKIIYWVGAGIWAWFLSSFMFTYFDGKISLIGGKFLFFFSLAFWVELFGYLAFFLGIDDFDNENRNKR